MSDHTLLDLVSLIAFTFGALAFSVLVLMYVRQRQKGSPIFAVFTAVCAAAFLINLALQIAPGRAVGLSIVQGTATSLMLPLMLHLVYAKEAAYLSYRRLWIFLLAVLYSISVLGAILEISLSEWIPALSLGACAALALTTQLLSSRALDRTGRNQRRWNQAIFATMICAAALNLRFSNPLTSLLPDYLLLAFFCVTLYYEERLMFFDLLIKRGAFFAVSLIALTVIIKFAAPLDWMRSWTFALLLSPLWLAAPSMYRRIEAAIDRGWLRRRYSLPDAEQRFVQDIQIASTETDLRDRAASSLGEIFQAPASVSFEAADQTSSALMAALDPHGFIGIDKRSDGMPLLSDDLRLLQSLARTLAVVLDNVRFREREQHLRSLATRAELRALRAQMNPHFLFNALNAIAGLIEEQPRLADETIEHLAHVLRYTLRHSENEWVRLDEEMEFVAAYLRVEQARFGERLCVEIGVDQAAASFPVPAMSIQPLVENAIKHGVSAVEGVGIVRVKVALGEKLLRVAISDNGPGFPSDFSIGSNGHGLRNIAERIAGYYGDCARLSWKCEGQGTHISLILPVRSENNGHAHLNRG
jgi:hypothetical protein